MLQIVAISLGASVGALSRWQLSLWLNPRVDAATEECDFDLRELRTKPMSMGRPLKRE